MPKTYKVWVQIEEIDEEADWWENVCEPDSIYECNNLDEAQDFVASLVGFVDKARNYQRLYDGVAEKSPTEAEAVGAESDVEEEEK